MKDELISYQTAQFAKDKGFDIIQNFGNISSLYNKSGTHTYYTNYGFFYSGLNDGYISAPTQSLLQRWLREKHNIELWFGYLDKPNVYHVEDIIKDDIIVSGIHVGSKTYEEALELGLQEALKFI